MKTLRGYLLAFWGLSIGLLGAFYIQTKLTPSDKRYHTERTIAKKLLLTDLCLSTESRHTRHISMPEWIAPFQDLPGYHDHFPSSSFFQVELEREASPIRVTTNRLLPP